MIDEVKTREQHEATEKTLHECASIYKEVMNEGKVNDLKTSNFYSLVYAYFVSVKDKRNGPLKQDHSFYVKADYVLNEKEPKLEYSKFKNPELDDIKEYIREYLRYMRNCNVTLLIHHEASPQAKRVKYPIDKAQELIYMLDYYLQHDEQIELWAKDKKLEAYLGGYKRDILVATLAKLQTIDQKLTTIKNNTFNTEEDLHIIPNVKREGLFMNAPTKVEFVNLNKLTDIVFQQLSENVINQLTEEDIEVLEDFCPAHICLVTPGVFVLNLEADFPGDTALIFVVTENNGISVFSTEYGLSEMNKFQSRKALIYWLTENLDSFGKLMTIEGTKGTTYEQLNDFLNALPY